MASETWFAESESAFYYAGTGRVPAEEVLAAARRLLSVAKTSPINCILVDLSSVAALEISVSQVHILAAISLEASSFCPRARLAIAAPKAQAYGLARMWSVFMEDGSWKIQVFHDRESAVAWLDISGIPDDKTALDLPA